jgi:hypothetical protein
VLSDHQGKQGYFAVLLPPFFLLFQLDMVVLELEIGVSELSVVVGDHKLNQRPLHHQNTDVTVIDATKVVLEAS